MLKQPITALLIDDGPHIARAVRNALALLRKRNNGGSRHCHGSGLPVETGPTAVRNRYD